MSERVLVIGAGFLGGNIAKKFKEHIIIQTNLTKINKNSYILDITDEKQVIDCFHDVNPSIVINCAANTNIDFLERNTPTAYSINGEGIRNLAVTCKRSDVRLVHISTDGIFDGVSGNYTEEDKPNPINVYAKSKVIGEENIMKNCLNHVIVRTNFYGNHPQGKSLFNNILSKLKNREQFTGFDDVIFSPLEVSNLSDLIFDVTFSNYRGILNLSSNESISKYQFCCKMADVFGFDSNLIKKGSIDDARFIAKRPKNTSLTNTKSKQFTKSKIMSLEDGLLKIKDFI
ncbi:SDR family oxidoreductase [Nitrosopumilus sp.]|nr:SDR family oxidoreductase [Nitrosopumilus sp.]